MQTLKVCSLKEQPLPVSLIIQVLANVSNDKFLFNSHLKHDFILIPKGKRVVYACTYIYMCVYIQNHIHIV